MSPKHDLRIVIRLARMLGPLLLILAACTSVKPLSPPGPTLTALPSPLSIVLSPAPFDGLAEWEGRDIFRPGLVSSEQGWLERLDGASVYRLNVRIAADYRSLVGRERVRYTNREVSALDAVYFQLFPNMEGGQSRMAEVLVDGQPAHFSYEENASSARVELAPALAPGKAVVVQLDFKVDLPQEAGGNYGLFGYLKGVLVLDGFYPAIPVFDEQGWHNGPLPNNSDTTFQDASFYQVRVSAPAGLVLAGTGLKTVSAGQAGEQVVTFTAGPARDFYLAGSEQFQVQSLRLGETLVNSYAPENLAVGSAQAAQVAVDALQAYSRRMGAYPYTELDIVSIPMNGALGIEYPGIVGINSSSYPLGKLAENPSGGSIFEPTVAHEVGHQWFYNLVGNDQMNAPWLDESLTQYITALYYLDRYGAAGYEGYKASWENRWGRAGRDPIAIGLPAAQYSSKEYGAIVYGRGPLFVAELANRLGKDGFDRFLRDYFQNHRWGVVTPQAFRAEAEAQCGCDLGAVFAEWVDGEQ